MNRYEEGIKLIEESCGNGKDNVIALSTVVMEPNADGMPSSCVRDVDAYYEDGVSILRHGRSQIKCFRSLRIKRPHLLFASRGFTDMGLVKILAGCWIRRMRN